MHEMEKMLPNFQSMHHFLTQWRRKGKVEGMLKPNSTTSSKRRRAGGHFDRCEWVKTGSCGVNCC